MRKKKLALTIAAAVAFMISSASSSLPAVVYAQENVNVVEAEKNVTENSSEELFVEENVAQDESSNEQTEQGSENETAENPQEVLQDINNTAEFNVSEGSISIENNTVTMNGESVETDGPIVLTGDSSENTIDVRGDVNLIFNNLNLSTSSKDKPVVNINHGNVVIELQGSNSLTNVDGEYACLRVSNSTNLTVDGQGSLTVNNGDNTKSNPAYGSGIGGNYQESPGSITINDGNIFVVEYGTAAAIGGGAWADSGKILIAGGTVEVQVYDGGDQAAGTGIGGGAEGYEGANHIGKGGSADVSITGGNVTAVVKPDASMFGPCESGAAIGSGQNKGGNIYVGGNAVVNAKAWGESAAIGGGAGVFSSSGGNVNPSQDDPWNIIIEGQAQVNAETVAVDVGEPYPSGAGIGSGSFNHQKCNIIIKGNSKVNAKNGAYGAGIGGAFEHSYPESVSVTITENAVVDAASDWFGAGIGTGRAQALPKVSSSVTISGNANVRATGGKGGYDLNGGAGIGAGSESWIDSVIISDNANVVAVGGTDASAIGGAISTPQFGNIQIGKDANLEAYADGTLFAVDTRYHVDGITNSMLNARFVEGANEEDTEKAFYIELDGNQDRKLTLPANYRSFASTTSINDVGIHKVYVKSNDTVYAYYPEDNSKLIQYDVKNQQMLTKDNLNWITNTVPEIKAEDKTFKVGDTFNNEIALKDVTAYDNEDKDVTDSLEVIEHNVDTSVAGTYFITYRATDSQGASSTKTINVYVYPTPELINHIPAITAEDKTLKVGDTFDPLKDVTALDKEDGSLTDKVEVLYNTVDINNAGVYEVTYKVTDSKGASSTKTIQVTVNEKDTPIVPDKPDPGKPEPDKQDPEEPDPGKPEADKPGTEATNPDKPDNDKDSTGTDDKGSVETGDQTKLGLYASLLAISALSIVILAVWKKKKGLENR